MLIDRKREKLINVILYFAQNTCYLGKIKLFKLLYLLDFEHFRETGRSVTGLHYKAWKFGPVPPPLMQEWEEPGEDLQRAIEIEPVQVYDHVRQAVRPRLEFDDLHFTKREIRIMEHLSARYADAYSPHMIDVTHAENGAWASVWNDGHGFDQLIPYETSLAQDSEHRDAILQAAREYELIAAETGQQGRRDH